MNFTLDPKEYKEINSLHDPDNSSEKNQKVSFSPSIPEIKIDHTQRKKVIVGDTPSSNNNNEDVAIEESLHCTSPNVVMSGPTSNSNSGPQTPTPTPIDSGPSYNNAASAYALGFFDHHTNNNNHLSAYQNYLDRRPSTDGIIINESAILQQQQQQHHQNQQRLLRQRNNNINQNSPPNQQQQQYQYSNPQQQHYNNNGGATRTATIELDSFNPIMTPTSATVQHHPPLFLSKEHTISVTNNSSSSPSHKTNPSSSSIEHTIPHEIAHRISHVVPVQVEHSVRHVVDPDASSVHHHLVHSVRQNVTHQIQFQVQHSIKHEVVHGKQQQPLAGAQDSQQGAAELGGLKHSIESVQVRMEEEQDKIPHSFQFDPNSIVQLPTTQEIRIIGIDDEGSTTSTTTRTA